MTVHCKLSVQLLMLFSIDCFTDCVFCLGSVLAKEEFNVKQNLVLQLSFYPISELFHCTVYLASNQLLNIVCIEMLSLDTTPQLLNWGISTFGEENYHVKLFLTFLKMSCGLLYSHIFKACETSRTTLKTIIRNGGRCSQLFISKHAVFLCPCPFVMK